MFSFGESWFFWPVLVQGKMWYGRKTFTFGKVPFNRQDLCEYVRHIYLIPYHADEAW